MHARQGQGDFRFCHLVELIGLVFRPEPDPPRPSGSIEEPPARSATSARRRNHHERSGPGGGPRGGDLDADHRRSVGDAGLHETGAVVPAATPPSIVLLAPRTLPESPGGGGQLTVVRVDNDRPLRKVPSPGNTGSGGSPTGESPSSGAETTQLGGTVKRDALETPSGTGETADFPGASPERREEEFPRPSRRARSRMLSEQKGAYDRDLAAPAGNRRGVLRGRCRGWKGVSPAGPGTAMRDRSGPPLSRRR